MKVDYSRLWACLKEKGIKNNTVVNLLSLNHLMLIQGVEWQLKQLRDDGLLRHVGATKNGHWETIKEER